jgi:hypothetical protein
VRMGGDFVCGHRVFWHRLIVIFVQKCVYLDVFWCVDSRISWQIFWIKASCRHVTAFTA